MKTLMRLAAVALALLFAGEAQAQVVHKTVVRFKDVADAAYNYCSASDIQTARGAITTSGSSTTLNAVAGNTPFAGMAVGDVLYIPTGSGSAQVINVRRIVTYTSNVLVVVDAAINLTSGTVFAYQLHTCGTATDSGWVDVNGTNAAVYLYVTDLNATSVDYVVQYRSRPAGTGYIQITPAVINSEAVGSNSAVVPIPNTAEQVRVGLKITADAGVQDVNVVLSYVALHQQ